MTDALIAFLKARLDEDEAAAVKAAEADKYGERPNWSALGNIIIDASDPDWAVVDLSPCFEDASIGAHIARHDPARVLREVEAKRAILRRCEQQASKEHDNAMEEDRTWVLWPVLFDLAAAYNDHPDYREDWRP